MNNSLKHVISVDDGLAKFYGLSIWRVVDCSTTCYDVCILVNTNTYNNGNYKHVNNSGSYKYINNNGDYKYINNNGNYKCINNNGNGNGKIWQYFYVQYQINCKFHCNNQVSRCSVNEISKRFA